MANCIYKYKGKDYTKEEFYSLVSSSNFIQQEQAKKFAELQERLNNKEFLEGAKNAFESSEELQNVYYEAAGFKNNVVFETERGSVYYLNKGKTKRDKKTSTGRVEKFSESDKTVYITKEDFKTLRENSEGLKDLEWSDNSVTVTNDSNRKTTISVKNNPEIGLIPLELVKGIEETETGYREDKRINIKSYSFLPNNVSFHAGHKIVSINTQITPQQKQQALNAYTDYIARVSLGIVKNPSSGEYNYNSQAKDIVYHFSNVKIDKPNKEKFSLSANINRRRGFFGISENINPGNNFANVEGTIPHAMLFNMKNPDFGDFSVIPPVTAKDETKDSAIIKQRGGINYYAVFEPEQIHILGSKQDIEGFKEFVQEEKDDLKPFIDESNKIGDESINDRLRKYEESIKIPNNVKSKVLEKIEKETQKVKEKLLSLGLKQEGNKFELITNSYATFRMKLKELENVNAIISTNKTSDFYQIIARLKNVDSTMELKKQGELPFTPIEVKQVIQEQQFLNDIADNVFEGLSEEEKQILKKKIENGDYDLNCKI